MTHETPLSELHLTTRTRNMLINVGVDTVEKLRALDLESFRKEHMVGPVTMREIVMKLKRFDGEWHAQRSEPVVADAPVRSTMSAEDEEGFVLDVIASALDAAPMPGGAIEAQRFMFGVAVRLPSGRKLLVQIKE